MNTTGTAGSSHGLLLRLRRRLMTPSRREVDPAHRGFQPGTDKADASLKRAGNSFLDGFEIAAGTPSADQATTRLELIDPARRGFAYEGAAMALALLDGFPVGHRHHVRDLLAAGGDRHHYMVHVGAGWALARLPRPWWSAAAAGLTDPLLTWLALDGYGFHQAYFRPDKYVFEAHVPARLSWPTRDDSRYAHHAVDQGIGRALWFVEGADPARVTRRILTFHPSRRGDLYAGIGLAATYAGGVDGDDLQRLLEAAGQHRADVAQGSIFAAEARRRAGHIEPHTEVACRALVGAGAVEAADIALECMPGPDDSPNATPAYETWRQSIMERTRGVHGAA